jgi:hypothetical protein
MSGRDYYLRNREKCIEQSKKYNHSKRNDPEFQARKRASDKRWKEANKDRVRALNRKSQTNRKEKRRAEYKEWAERNKEHLAERRRQYYENNKDREDRLNRQWRENNPDKVRAAWERRRRAIRRATPHWVNRAELHEVFKNCPSELVVDHIVPVQGRNVSGLNVPWNLCYVTRRANIIKGNRHETG